MSALKFLFLLLAAFLSCFAVGSFAICSRLQSLTISSVNYAKVLLVDLKLKAPLATRTLVDGDEDVGVAG
jgi:uncharacterized protein (UPF0333 family)